MSRRYGMFDRDGHAIDDAVCPDGGSVRVSMLAMDGLDDVQRGIAADAKRRKTVQYDPFGRVKSTFEEEEADAMTFDAAMHRPGYRSSTTVNDDEAAKAYREYVDAQCNAWKKRDAQKPVTRQDAAPTGPVFDAAEGHRIKDAAWRAMCEEQSNAWRKKQ